MSLEDKMQIKSDTLKIDDTDQTTSGGPKSGGAAIILIGITLSGLLLMAVGMLAAANW